MSQPFAYDQVDYPSLLHPQMHPSRLGAIARLHGIRAASPSTCRLLEVGCGDGLQLITLAMAYPQGRFIGVDLSAHAIARGEAVRASLGLDNLQLVAADLLRWQPDATPYDYILAHGFYSWVPEPVRERLLRLCGEHLAPGGIAYVSYNALPGSHLRRMLWEILQFHAGTAPDPAAAVQRASECMDLLMLGMPEGMRYRAAMAGEIKDLKARMDPRVLFHDDLAAINDPFTLDQFMRAAGRHGLGFVAEASYHEMSLHNAHPDARGMLEEVARDDVVTKEQYLDFFTGRRFRQTILCRATATPRPADADAIAGLEVVTDLVAAAGPVAERGVRFDQTTGGGGLETDDRLLQGILEACGDSYPQALPVAQFLDGARLTNADGPPTEPDAQRALRALLRAFEAGLLELHIDAPRFARRATGCAVASPLARLQAATGEDHVASLRPAMVQLEDPLTRRLLLALDGSRDRAAVVAFMLEPLAQASTDGGADLQEVLESRLDEALERICALALLCADGAGPPDADGQRTR